MENAKETNEVKSKKDRYKALTLVVKDHGYPIEKHVVTTLDNYINTCFRISGPRGTNAEQNETKKRNAQQALLS